MSPKRQSELTTELALLGFLRMRPMHGYEIHQCLTDPAGLAGLWRVKLSRLYALLGRLESVGYVSARIEPQVDRPQRKVFSLTPAGTAVFLDWVEAPVSQPRDIRLTFMLKLYFARLESTATAQRLITAQQAVCAGWLAGPLIGPASLTTQDLGDVVRSYRLGQIEATSRWLAWLVEIVSEVDHE